MKMAFLVVMSLTGYGKHQSVVRDYIPMPSMEICHKMLKPVSDSIASGVSERVGTGEFMKLTVKPGEFVEREIMTTDVHVIASSVKWAGCIEIGENDLHD